jgi:hypothetical protein
MGTEHPQPTGGSYEWQNQMPREHVTAPASVGAPASQPHASGFGAAWGSHWQPHGSVQSTHWNSAVVAQSVGTSGAPALQTQVAAPTLH